MSIDFFFFFRFQQNLPLRHIAVLNKEKGSVCRIMSTTRILTQIFIL